MIAVGAEVAEWSDISKVASADWAVQMNHSAVSSDEAWVRWGWRNGNDWAFKGETRNFECWDVFLVEIVKTQEFYVKRVVGLDRLRGKFIEKRAGFQ